MSRLQAEYPHTTFVHVTAPLTAVPHDGKTWIKRVIGRTVRSEDDNVARCRFNEMLRAHYEGKEPLLDLADPAVTRGVRDVPDPYYSGGFDYVYELVRSGCQGLLAHILDA